MNKDAIKELINYYKDVRKDFWNCLVLLIAGMIGIVFSINKVDFTLFTIIKSIFFIGGILAIYQFINIITNFNEEIFSLIDKIKKDN